MGGGVTINSNPVCSMPIGFGVILFTDISPAELWGGTWQKVEEGYALWTATSGAGQTIDAGLPNILGSTHISAIYSTDMFINKTDGCIYATGDNSDIYQVSRSSPTQFGKNILNIDASKSNSIYGNSNTVQPPAIKIYLWRRVA